METDILALGGGPSGLAAAYEAARNGLKVIIAEEAFAPGGQLRQQTQLLEALPAPFAGLRGFELAAKLVQRLQGLPVEILLGHTVIGTYADGSVGLSDGQTVKKVKARSIIVATGAAETPLVFPGWTLPGVLTVGAAQILINRERVYPGKIAMVLGSSDMALETAKQMHDVGIKVLGIVEQSSRPLSRDTELISALEQRDIPFLLNTWVVSAAGRGRVEKVLLSDQGESERELAVEFICCDGGRHPIIEPYAVFKCAMRCEPALGGYLPCYTTALQTSAENIFTAGNSAGITLEAGVLLTGALAGLSASAYLLGNTREAAGLQLRLWQQLFDLEAAKRPDVWQARIAHMGICQQTELVQNPVEWPRLGRD